MGSSFCEEHGVAAGGAGAIGGVALTLGDGEEAAGVDVTGKGARGRVAEGSDEALDPHALYVA